ncbi:MAG: delta-aminolevulinic acid dehydratase [Bacteroidia bacterium]
MMNECLLQAIQKLQKYIESNDYKGYDPYDALKSPLFKLPILRSNKLIRFAAQQTVKRSPLNLRPLLFIQKGYNPVTLGLCIQAYSNFIKIYPEQKNNYEKKINFLVDELTTLIPANFHGACWGYDFDWEARYSKIQSYQPTIVTTGIITNALFQAYQTTNNTKAHELIVSASNFVLNDLHKSYDAENNFCYSYSPFDKQVIFNASMKGVRLLSHAYNLTQNEKLKSEAKQAVQFVINHQQNDGGWLYSTSATGGWIDNYHTGYVLDCLDEYITYCNDQTFQSNLLKGYKFYKENFFEDNKIPKFTDKKKFPIDCTAASQSILTLIRFNDSIIAKNLATWMIENMQSPEGFFYFRKFKNYTVKNSFMRWSNAWMFLGLSELLVAMKIKVNINT